MSKNFSTIDLLRPSDRFAVASATVDRSIKGKIIGRAKNGRWFINSQGYAYAFDRATGKRIFMHRVVMEIYKVQIKGLQVDHINRVRLDNYRANLRPCTAAENQVNRKLKCETDDKNGLIGVSTVQQVTKVDGVLRIVDVHQVGDKTFSNPTKAAKEADRIRRKKDGRFAVQNLPVDRKRKPKPNQNLA